MTVSFVGLFATSKRNPCLLRFYAFMLSLAFAVLLAGVACSLKVVFTIHVAHDSSSFAIPTTKLYGKDSMATYTWDKLHSIKP